jgi:polyphenol oxidase
MYDNNALEDTPHGPVHVYVGGQRRGVPGDMSVFPTAARDPIFFAHHGNLDRLWETWRRDPARKATEPKSDAFLQHKFVFTWLDGAPVDVPMSDILDIAKLGYTYDYLDVFRPNEPVVLASQAAPESLPAIATQKLNVPFAAQSANANERKYLEITGVQNPSEPMSVSVRVKPANALPGDRGTEIGTFAVVPPDERSAPRMRRLVFDMTDAARRYGGQDVTVELVPHRVGPDADQSFPPLKYERMQIITRGR